MVVMMTEQEDSSYRAYIYLFAILLAILGSILVSGCTLSFSNISTHGTATDVVDENQTAQPQIDTSVTVPALGGV